MADWRAIVGGIVLGLFFVSLIIIQCCINSCQYDLRKHVMDDFKIVMRRVNRLEKEVNRRRRNNNDQHSDSDAEDATQSREQEIRINWPE